MSRRTLSHNHELVRPTGVSKMASLKKVLEHIALHPRTSLSLVALLVLVAALGVPGVRVSSSYFALLPEDAPNVLEANRVRERTGGNEQLVIALSGTDPETLAAAAEGLAARAREREDVLYADATLDTSFFEERSLWLIDEPAVEELSAGVGDLVEALGETHGPFALELDPERDEQRTRSAVARIESVLASAERRRPDLDLTSDDGRYRFVVVVPAMRVMDVDRTAPLLSGLESIVDDLEAEHEGLDARFTGKFALVLEHQALLQRDLVVTSIVSLVLCVLIVALFLRSWWAPPILALAVGVGAFWTLGIVGASVGTLNIISTLLFPLMAGLGIDFSIHLAIRYEHAKRTASDAESAMREAVRETFAPALTGATTTAAAFLSLSFAELRGFSEFGWLAAIGILCALAATYLIVPSLLVLRDRRRPLPLTTDRGTTHAPKSRHSIALVVVIALVAVTGVGAVAVPKLRFENDYRLLRPDSDSDAFFAYVDSQIGIRFDPSVLVVDDEEDLRRARSIIERRRAARESRIDGVVGLDDFLPRRSDRRTRAIEVLRRNLASPMLASIADDRLAQLRAHARAEPWTSSELPDWVRERFVTRDGRGSVVLLYGREQIQSDRAALRWDAELDVLRAAFDDAGLTYDLTTEALLPAWVYEMILADAPQVIAIAAISVALLVLIHFVSISGRAGFAQALLVLFPLGAALVWSVALMSVAGMKVTMFTLIIFPCVIGIGVDDFVHVVHRHGHAKSLAALYRESGPAVVLTSLTTAIGFGTTLLAYHPGIANVGPAALIAITCTTLSALLFLPALLHTVNARTP